MRKTTPHLIHYCELSCGVFIRKFASRLKYWKRYKLFKDGIFQTAVIKQNAISMIFKSLIHCHVFILLHVRVVHEIILKQICYKFKITKFSISWIVFFFKYLSWLRFIIRQFIFHSSFMIFESFTVLRCFFVGNYKYYKLFYEFWMVDGSFMLICGFAICCKLSCSFRIKFEYCACIKLIWFIFILLVVCHWLYGPNFNAQKSKNWKI